MLNVLEKLSQSGLLSPEAADNARTMISGGAALDDALLNANGIPEQTLLRFLAEEFHVLFVEPEKTPPPREFLSKFPARLLLQHALLPLYDEPDGAILVATHRLFDSSGMDELRLAVGRDCRPALAAREEIDRCLRRLLGVGADTMQTLVSESDVPIQVLDRSAEEGVDLSEKAEDASIIRFVNEVLIEAIELRATDVHLEPFENELRVRYRVDGVLQEAPIPAEVRRFQAAIISRLKILSQLDIAEKRLPQDGRIKLSIQGREIDVRVSVIPMLHGEAIVLRLLDRGSALFGLKQLGMSATDNALFDRILEMPHGIILVTGPTGSGKTTTLYAALSRINDVARKIITIEDPVEYQLRGINQIQISSKAGLTFARGLRSILRHDPDVILIGEIRDRETADIAVQASLTGHLVFSTLHTNDAPGALTRLVDMGIEPYLVASSLEAVLAQRLVRLICRECRAPLAESELERVRKEFAKESLTELHAGKGCRACQGTGYRGRTGVFEFMDVTDPIRNLILNRASSGDIRAMAQRQGMQNLRQDGWRLVREGRTTVEEVVRVTKDERINGTDAPAAADVNKELV